MPDKHTATERGGGPGASHVIGIKLKPENPPCPQGPIISTTAAMFPGAAASATSTTPVILK
jgi:hypothetical protein